MGAPARVDHSTAGAKEAKGIISNALLGTIFAYCISGHHGGLLDYGSPVDDSSENTLIARLKRSVEDYSAYTTQIQNLDIHLPGLKIKPITPLGGFSISFFTRMLYSILVDADFIDTETVMNGGKKPRGGHEFIPSLSTKFAQYLLQFANPQQPINEYRTRILTRCIEKSSEKPGLFSLTVPTGGGKTFASMAFALNHAVTHKLKRIIYVIPFTSIIEQNAALFKSALGPENVLEHHSNFDWNPKGDNNQSEGDFPPDGENVYAKLKLATENWDIPIVVTTNVQFFESLFANRSSRCRKVHNISKSVIIFDEAQMIPRDFIKPCMLSVAELVTNYGASAIFCTATQPILERFLPVKVSPPIELAEDPHGLYQALKRVKVINLDKVSDEALVQRLNQHKQALCIVNTRKHAKGLLAGIDPENRYHLSTLMCAAHRKSVLARVRSHLKQGEPCRLVSTQLIEAGVDLDFQVGFRALAGLDSIIQAAGRINREQKLEIGELFVFEPDSPLVKRIPAYIQQGAEVTRKVLRDHQEDPVSLSAIRDYYQQLYDLQDANISFDREDILGCFEKKAVSDAVFDFKTAAQKFRMIENATVSVIVAYDDTARKLIEEVRTSINPQRYIRVLQPYTVNIFEQEFEALNNLGWITVYQEIFNVLNREESYDDETGLLIPERTQGDAVFS
jgi:CRISPR-associated endonuclease/helicase Cas3